MIESHRAVLGVERGADAEAIRAAYRRAAKLAHPDRGGSSEAFRRVRTAADTLLAELEAGPAREPGQRPSDIDRASRTGPWGPIAADLWDIWGLAREPFTVIAPRKIGLSSFVDDAANLNLPAYDWLIRTAGPRGEGWEFHSTGDVTRVFFRREGDARLFRLRFP